MSEKSVRDFGRPNSRVIGVPRVLRQLQPADVEGHEVVCPNCGCATIYEVEVTIEQPLLKGGKGVGKYLGCPACPWASPMLCLAEGAS